MRIIALIMALLGISILGLLMVNLKAVEVDSLNGLDRLEANAKVKVEGRVIEERILYKGTKLMKIKDLEIICECSRSFKGDDVRVEGVVEEYNNRRQIRALRVDILS